MFWLHVIAAWLFADLITGAFHWFEDRYLDPNDAPFLFRDIAAENELHHVKPTAMTLSSHWANMRQSAMIAWPIAMVLWLLQMPMWLWLGVFFAAFANLIHRLAHEPRKKLPRWIRGLQEFGVFISKEHHDSHHRDESGLVSKSNASIAYCAMTDWVNPVVDYLRVWSLLEWILRQFGIKPLGA